MDIQIKKKIDSKWLTYEEVLKKYYHEFYKYHKKCFELRYPFVNQQDIEEHTYKVLNEAFRTYDARCGVPFVRLVLKIHWSRFFEIVHS